MCIASICSVGACAMFLRAKGGGLRACDEEKGKGNGIECRRARKEKGVEKGGESVCVCAVADTERSHARTGDRKSISAFILPRHTHLLEKGVWFETFFLGNTNTTKYKCLLSILFKILCILILSTLFLESPPEHYAAGSTYGVMLTFTQQVSKDHSTSTESGS